jgi:hypothetical protein
VWEGSGLGRPGSDLLSHALRRSTIGAEGFHGRVRDGIGWITPRHCHQVIEARLGLEGWVACCVFRLLGWSWLVGLLLGVCRCAWWGRFWPCGGDQADRAISRA